MTTLHELDSETLSPSTTPFFEKRHLRYIHSIYFYHGLNVHKIIIKIMNLVIKLFKYSRLPVYLSMCLYIIYSFFFVNLLLFQKKHSKRLNLESCSQILLPYVNVCGMNISWLVTNIIYRIRDVWKFLSHSHTIMKV